MMVMTAKVDLKKILLGLAAAAALVLALILLLGESSTAQTAAPVHSANDQRIKFLTDFGWDVVTSPVESSQVRIPEDSSEVFDRYNRLQKSQGYDLSQYAGKTVMRYVYQVNNYPGATEPIYATLLVYKNQIIGGDITDTATGGSMQALQSTAPTTPATVPSETSAPMTEGSMPAE